MKYYAIIAFDRDQKQKVHYYTSGPLYIYFKGLYDHVVYRVFIDDIFSIEIKEEEDNG